MTDRRTPIAKKVIWHLTEDPTLRYYEIAEIIGCHPSTVSMVAAKHGFTPQSRIIGNHIFKCLGDKRNVRWIMKESRKAGIDPWLLINAAVTDARLDDEDE